MASNDVFVARQPILDRRLELYGYELLARVGPENSFDPEHVRGGSDQASIDLLHATVDVIQLEKLANRKQIFFNATRSILLSDMIELLPSQQTVVELLETVTGEPDVVAAATRLKRAGYGIALDDFVPSPALEPLVELADILKVDFQDTTVAQRKAIRECYGTKGRVLLAEKVESQEDVKCAIELGYTLFQGYFFCAPEMFHAREQRGNELNALNLLQELGRGELDLDKIEQIFRGDPTLSVKLLRYLNSAVFGLRNPITSIRQALVHLGERALRRWGSMTAVSSLGDDRPSELVTTTLVRARFAEVLGHIASALGNVESYFLVGLLSTLDAMLALPMEEALDQVSVAPQIRDALTGDDESRLGRILQLVLAYERGDWDEAETHAERLTLSRTMLASLYRQATEWTDLALGSESQEEAAA